jgi:H/ACA ribonucleoprotein complex subunit 1
MRHPPVAGGRGFSGRTAGRGFGRGGSAGRGSFKEETPDLLVGKLLVFLYLHFITHYYVEIGSYSHSCEGEIICKLTNSKVNWFYSILNSFYLNIYTNFILHTNIPQIPYFNGTIFLENKSKVGKVEEIFGPIDNSVSIEFEFVFGFDKFSLDVHN